MANDKENQDDTVTRAAIALLGDLAANLPATGPLFQGKAWVTDLLGQARVPGCHLIVHAGMPGRHGVASQCGHAWPLCLLPPSGCPRSGRGRYPALSGAPFLNHVSMLRW